jgi:hypothetical protein
MYFQRTLKSRVDRVLFLRDSSYSVSLQNLSDPALLRRKLGALVGKGERRFSGQGEDDLRLVAYASLIHVSRAPKQRIPS